MLKNPSQFLIWSLCETVLLALLFKLIKKINQIQTKVFTGIVHFKSDNYLQQHFSSTETKANVLNFPA